MDVTPLVKEGAKIIQSYAGGTFRVSGQVYSSPIFVLPHAVVPWPVDKKGIEDLEYSDFGPILAQSGDIDVLFVGTGRKLVFMNAPLKQSLKQNGMVPECMDTGAACRTYNVLMAEGRRVCAALFPV